MISMRLSMTSDAKSVHATAPPKKEKEEETQEWEREKKERSTRESDKDRDSIPPFPGQP